MNMNNADIPRTSARQGGFTLVELLVAMAVGAALMVGIVQVFIGSKATYRVMDSLSRIQENGRFALDNMAWTVRMADYKGCMSGNSTNITNSLNSADTALYNFSTGIEGFDAVNQSFNDGYLSVTLESVRRAAANDDELEDFELIKAGSVVHDEPDAVIVRAFFGDPIRKVKQTGSTNPDGPDKANIFVEFTGVAERACSDGTHMYSGFCTGDIALISDCRQQSRIFQITNAQRNGERVNFVHSRSGRASPGNQEIVWGSEFGVGVSEIMKAGTRIYFIANRLGLDGQSEPVPSLFVLDERGIADILAENVEDLQITYGVDTESGIAALNLRVTKEGLDATAVANSDDWQRVVGAKIRLLARSGQDFVAPDNQPQAYFFDGIEYKDHDDRRIRREFVTSVTLRNRALDRS